RTDRETPKPVGGLQARKWKSCGRRTGGAPDEGLGKPSHLQLRSQAQPLLCSAQWVSFSRFSSYEPEKAATQTLHAEGKTVRRLNGTGAPDVRRDENACAGSADQEAGRGDRRYRLVRSSRRRRRRPAEARRGNIAGRRMGIPRGVGIWRPGAPRR